MSGAPTTRKVNGEKEKIKKKVELAYPTTTNKEKKNIVSKLWGRIRINKNSHHTAIINVDEYNKIMVELQQKAIQHQSTLNKFWGDLPMQPQQSQIQQQRQVDRGSSYRFIAILLFTLY